MLNWQKQQLQPHQWLRQTNQENKMVFCCNFLVLFHVEQLKKLVIYFLLSIYVLAQSDPKSKFFKIRLKYNSNGFKKTFATRFALYMTHGAHKTI